jgi:hypothetical protein
MARAIAGGSALLVRVGLMALAAAVLAGCGSFGHSSVPDDVVDAVAGEDVA